MDDQTATSCVNDLLARCGFKGGASKIQGARFFFYCTDFGHQIFVHGIITGSALRLRIHDGFCDVVFTIDPVIYDSDHHRKFTRLVFQQKDADHPVTSCICLDDPDHQGHGRRRYGKKHQSHFPGTIVWY
jgi:hypothetical protein